MKAELILRKESGGDMTYQGFGIVTKSNGGLFSVLLYPVGARLFPQGREPQPLDGLEIPTRARGNLRRRGALLVGDRVRVGYTDEAFRTGSDGSVTLTEDGGGATVEEILPRSSALIRPPMANLGVLFVTVAAADPAPDLLTLDKLIAIAEHNAIEPVMVITKTDRSAESAARLADIYRLAGFAVFAVDSLTGEGVSAVRMWINDNLGSRIAAFSGASGVGKSTLLNRLFPSLGLETGSLSERIMRGKNTTRAVELYRVGDGFLADTPGFTMLDFDRFDFFGLDGLLPAFREFTPCIGQCRYRKCTHTKEDGCAILAAVADGKIAPSRHRSYVVLYETLKEKARRNR